MNIVDQFYAVLIYIWSEIDKVAVSAGLTAYAISLLKGNRKHRESILCGVFATIAITSITFIIHLMGIPDDGIVAKIVNGGASFIGGAIGWYGTDRTVKYVESKLGGKNE